MLAEPSPEAHRFGQVGSLLLAALVALGAFIATEANADANTEDAVRLAARGSVLFAEHGCASCHTKTATPGPTGLTVPLENLSERYTAGLLAELFDVPPPDMPRFPLTPEERRALAVYLLAREQGPANARPGAQASPAEPPALLR